MKRIKNILTTANIMASLILTPSAFAGENWYVSTTASVMPGKYSGSEQRNSLFSGSLLLNADYLDTFNFAIAYNKSSIDFKKINGTGANINQNSYAGRLQYHFFSDSLGGIVTTQLVMHNISNDDITTLTDNVSVIAPKLSYLNYDKDFYMDIEYVKSSYPNNSDLTITQYTPSLGFSFNKNSDWLSFKAYLINSSNKNLSQNEDSLSSLDIKWTHWSGPDALLGINNFFIDILTGNRIFAVDNDAFAVYNLADLQKGSLSVGASWKIKQNIDVTAILGIEDYENKPINNSYKQQYLYFSLTKHW